MLPAPSALGGVRPDLEAHLPCGNLKPTAPASPDFQAQLLMLSNGS